MQKLTQVLQQSPLWQEFKNWYELRSANDRRALQILFTALIVSFLYLVIWDPVIQWSEKNKDDYQHQQMVHSWLQDNLSQAKELQKKQRSGIGQREFSSVVSGAARKAGITLSRVQPDKKGLSVWVEDAAYQKLLNWLVVLDTKNKIVIQQVRLDKLKEEGRVKAYLHLGN